MADDTTMPKTLWSETLLEMLAIALKKNRSDREILRLLGEIRAKGFRASYVVSKVSKDSGQESIPRLKSLIKRLKKSSQTTPD